MKQEDLQSVLRTKAHESGPLSLNMPEVQHRLHAHVNTPLPPTPRELLPFTEHSLNTMKHPEPFIQTHLLNSHSNFKKEMSSPSPCYKRGNKLSKVTQWARDRASTGSGSVAASAGTWWWSRLGQRRELDTMCPSCSVTPSELAGGLSVDQGPHPHTTVHAVEALCKEAMGRPSAGVKERGLGTQLLENTEVGLQGHCPALPSVTPCGPGGSGDFLPSRADAGQHPLSGSFGPRQDCLPGR